MNEEIDLGRYGAETGLNMSAREPLIASTTQSH